MNLIGLELGRVIILFGGEEIRPRQGIPILKAVTAVKDRYQFLSAPDISIPISQVEKDGYRFEGGVFEFDGEEVAIRELGIYNDGISVTAYDTSFAEAFLDDFLGWATTSLGLRSFEKAPRRLYRSQLVVEFSKPLAKSLKNFSAISAALEDSLGCRPVDISRIDFAVDPTQLTGSFKPTPFSIERRVNYPYEDERYFCEAPLSTRAHVQVLKSLEAALE